MMSLISVEHCEYFSTYACKLILRAQGRIGSIYVLLSVQFCYSHSKNIRAGFIFYVRSVPDIAPLLFKANGGNISSVEVN